ncbi:MAG: site-2 protease family protein [Chloroflexota bacterium]
MRAGVTVCRLRGIPIDLQASWPPVFFFVAWTLAERFFPRIYPPWSLLGDWSLGLLSSGLLFGSLLAHEFGHALVARGRGLTVYRISLFLFGGVAEIDLDGGKALDEFWLASAGPAVSLALAIICLGLWLEAIGLDPHFRAIALYLGMSNGLLGAFNLLPGYPLDGGRILRSALWSIDGNLERATRYARWSGQVLGGAILLAGLAWLAQRSYVDGGWLAALGLFLILAARDAIPRSLLLPS